MTGSTPTENIVAELRSLRTLGGLSPAHLMSSDVPTLGILLNRPRAKDRYELLVRFAYDLGPTESGICARRALYIPDESPRLPLSKTTAQRRVEDGFRQLAALVIEHATHEGVPYVEELESGVVRDTENMIAHVKPTSEAWKAVQNTVQQLVLDHLHALTLLDRVRTGGWEDEFAQEIDGLRERGNSSLIKLMGLLNRA